MEKILNITERTLVPVSFLLLFVGFVGWLTNLYSETKAHGADISEIKETNRTYNEKLDRILEKLGRIEGTLRIIKNEY